MKEKGITRKKASQLIKKPRVKQQLYTTSNANFKDQIEKITLSTDKNFTVENLKDYESMDMLSP
jgi:CMP-N-acetylneuraminic acid synthetase